VWNIFIVKQRRAKFNIVPFHISLILRPFRAHWRNYEDDHLQIVVDCHFMIKPTGDEYWDNRQNVLEAINQAATKTGVHFEIRSG